MSPTGMPFSRLSCVVAIFVNNLFLSLSKGLAISRLLDEVDSIEEKYAREKAGKESLLKWERLERCS